MSLRTLVVCMIVMPFFSVLSAFAQLDSSVPGFSSTAPSLPNSTGTFGGAPRTEFLSDARQSNEGSESSVESFTITYESPLPKYADFGTPQPAQTRKTVTLTLDSDLESLELPPDAKRYAVLMITAKRHPLLMKELQDAESPEEHETALAALKENYQKHYAIETWWRTQKLEKLEAELKKMQEQVQKRVDSESKYVEATMTIAILYATGISTAPPPPAMPQGSRLGTPTGPYFPSVNGGTVLGGLDRLAPSGNVAYPSNGLPSTLPGLQSN